MINLPELEPLTESLFCNLRSAADSAARLADLLAVYHDLLADSAGLWKPVKGMTLEDRRFYIIRSVTTRKGRVLAGYKPALARWDRIAGWMVEHGHLQWRQVEGKLETEFNQFDTIQVLV